MKKSDIQRLSFIFLVMLLWGCGSPAVDPPQIPLRSDIEAALSEWTSDWILSPPHDIFTFEQLDWLLAHRLEVSEAVTSRVRQSTAGIQLVVFLRVESAVPVLRDMLLTLRRVRKWEGPDYSTPDPYLLDNHYPYQCIYIWAIQEISLKPVAEVVALTSTERAYLRKKASNAVVERHDGTFDDHAWNAKWLLLKLEPVSDSSATSK